MNKSQLYDSLIGLWPFKSDEKDGFRTTVSKQLKDYVRLIKKLNVDEQPNYWRETLSRVNQLCDGINRAIKFEYMGVRHSAYAAIKNQLDGYVSKQAQITRLAYDDNILTIPAGMVAYRMRKVAMEEQLKLKRKDMFHIPLDKKGLVQTQRYSVPGYPCLYLSHSLYGCWEEMGRPDFGTVMVSKFVSKKAFRVLDLRIPSKEAWQENMTKCILFFPLIIVSMVQVKNNKDFYKPEYLIPQLLTEWIISHNRDNQSDQEIIGILYSSAQKNTDFDYPHESYDNYAIPVLKPFKSKKYCDRLSEMFELTAPTYYDLEILKDRKEPPEIGIEVEDGALQFINFKKSPFGKMEHFLKDAELKAVEEG